MLRKLVSNQIHRKWLNDICCTTCYRASANASKKRFSHSKIIPDNGPTLKDFIYKTTPKTAFNTEAVKIPYLDENEMRGDNQKVYLEIYGCQMNKNDAEVVWAILQKAGYERTTELQQADVVLLLTCALREGAEGKIWERLEDLNKLKRKKLRTDGVLHPKIALLGCMAERVKEQIIEKQRCVDVVAGPDSYKDLPRLLAVTRDHHKAINVMLSMDETYADIIPVRLNQNAITSYVTIMRGCDNMCTYCIVPFTRGKERARPIDSILNEVRLLSESGVKEVILLGQNVNSYRDLSNVDKTVDDSETRMAKGFKTVYKVKKGGVRFSELLHRVSEVDPEMRVRFTSPHPKDFGDDVLEVIKEKPNICNHIHLPAQSGNSVVLERMRRGYTREAYLELVNKIRECIPNVALSSDFIAGFCGETEQQFEDTLSLIQLARYHVCYFYGYSMREKTTAHRRYEDDIPEHVKLKRVARIKEMYRKIAEELIRAEVGKHNLVLIEGLSRKSDQHLVGRNDKNTKVIIPVGSCADSISSSELRPIKAGDYICVQITDGNSQTLRGAALFHTTLQEFHSSTHVLDSREKSFVNV